MPEPRNSEWFRLVGGHPVLDLVNTVAPRAAGVEPSEALNDVTDLLIWARRVELVDPAESNGVARAWRATPATGPQALRATIEIREASYAVLAGRLGVARAPSADAALERLTLHWSAAAARCRLGPDDNAAARLVVGTLPALVIPDRLAHAAIELLTRADLERMRVCPTEDGGCGWLFLDHSRNGSRRWCAMEDCGSQAKSRRLTERRRGLRATGKE